jgi:hypothetical protein
MAESPDLQSVLETAERAAAGGDHASAGQFLREALRLQEAALGPFHPDLASTLNNLAVVCEMSSQFGEAEQCYRRAFAVASAGLDADHPSVATSRQNLREFCEARGLPFDPPAPVTADVPPPPPPPAPADRVQPPPRVVEIVDKERQEKRAPTRRLVAGVAIVGALAVVVVVALRPWGSTGGAESPPPIQPTETAAEIAAPATGGDRPAPTRRTGTGSGVSRMTVVDAGICRDLSTGSGDWKCTRPSTPIGPGRLTFYTRIKSPTDTAVQHRWYRDGELRQAGELRVRANLNAGYRTYSRYTIDDRSRGNWRVELRAKDGAVLHEERFVVR